MRDPQRIDEVLEAIKATWQTHPDQRFGQLVINYSGACNIMQLWSIEDKEVLECLKLNLEEAITSLRKDDITVENADIEPKGEPQEGRV